MARMFALLSLAASSVACFSSFDVPVASPDESRANRRRTTPGSSEQRAREIVIDLRASEPISTRYDAREPARTSMLQRKVLAHLSGAIATRGDGALTNDADANRMAGDICRAKVLGPPPHALYEFAMRSHGLIDPSPRLLAWDIPDGYDALLDPRFERAVRRVAGVQGFRRAGIAECSSPRIHGRRLLVALIKSLARIDPIPRKLELGQAVGLRARLLAPRDNVQLFVTDPTGAVRQAEPRRLPEAGLFDAGEIQCRTRGVYQVEITGDGTYGPEVLLNFPLLCALEPDRAVHLRYRERELGSASDIEAELVARTNAFRARHGRAALAADPRLSEMARRHSQDMHDEAFFGHVSARTGSPANRAQSAGIPYQTLRENIAYTYRVEDVITGLAASPGHRVNLQATDVTLVGIGVVVDRSLSPPAIYVTQNLIAPASNAVAAASPTDALQLVNEARRQARLRPLRESAVLARKARRYLDERRSLGLERARARLDPRRAPVPQGYRLVALFEFEVKQLSELRRARPLVSTAATHVGFAMAQRGRGLEGVALLGRR